MPSPAAVILWSNENRCGFAEQYARAREIGYKLLAEELLEIADDGRNDWIELEDGRQPDHELVARSRMRLDTRKWLLSKALPKIYGDKLIHAGEGADGAIVTEIRYGWMKDEPA